MSYCLSNIVKLFKQNIALSWCGWEGWGWQALLQAFGLGVGSCGLANVPDSMGICIG